MKFLIFSDIHKDWEALNKVLNKKADIYICLGDFTQVGSGLNSAGKIFSQKKKNLWLIHGNSETPQQIKQMENKFAIRNFHNQLFKKGKYNFAGMGGSNLTPFNTPGDVEEEQLKKWLEKFKQVENLLLFTHVPPKNTSLDKISENMHVGSSAVRDFIKRNQPLYHFSGHVHENAGKKDRIGKTKCILVGKEGFELELSDK